MTFAGFPIELPGLVTRGTWASWATLSPCEGYRYMLGRGWDRELPVFSVVMLNPSTADHDVDDPTLRRCVHFARQERCGSVLVRNLFAWRATDPKMLVRMLARATDPAGPRNGEVLALALTSEVRVAAWGRIPPRLRQLAKREVLPFGIKHPPPKALHVLGLTTREPYEPRHPLYMPNKTRIVLWREALRALLPQPSSVSS